MVDKELAMKLAKRFNKLSCDIDNRAPFATEESTVQQYAVIPEPPPQLSPPPPPPPPSSAQLPLLQGQQIVSDKEWTDMDKLIEQTLYNLEVTSRKAPNNILSSMDYAPESLKKPLTSINIVDNLIQERTINHSDDINERSDLSPLSSKCSAPIVPIIHHKGNHHEQLKKFVSDDSILQKEREELEAKLARQRQKKPMIPMEAESAASFAPIDINAAEKEKSHPTPPPVLPKNISIDLNLTESQWEDSGKPSPISKKSASSVSAINLSIQ
ncbi:hypothetical protein WUBG_04973 [Wuchereria bancrofti]|uniref:Uncharacterized protein n=1 Tax=Wuchereria bancrofti TaxID=6293 RepID=J9BAJ9_WUCBA|nr:hypothetical protein WUBG_04973 [Wuchereria bancrofti]